MLAAVDVKEAFGHKHTTPRKLQLSFLKDHLSGCSSVLVFADATMGQGTTLELFKGFRFKHFVGFVLVSFDRYECHRRLAGLICIAKGD